MASAPRDPAPGRPSFGIDAPLVPLALGTASVVFLAVYALSPANLWALFVGCIMLVQVATYLHATLRGKHAAWRHLLDGLGLRGDEQLLDMGCGRGAVLLAAAARLPRGRATGVDLWRTVDQSGNAESVTAANAAKLGVADRVGLQTGDMTDLPFPDADFDVVTSSLAIHNIPTTDGRARAIDEAWRVTRPGGRIVIADIRHVRDYARRLEELGAVDVRSRNLGPGVWFAGPWVATSVVTATRG